MAWRRDLSIGADILSFGVAIVAAILLAGRFSTGSGGSSEAVADLSDGPVISLEGIPTLGHSAATVVLLEFSDYECPYCRNHARRTFKQLKTEFVDSGRIRYAFANNPLESIHPRAKYLATAAMCAEREGRFWDMHAAMFARERVTDDALMTIVADLRLDSSQLLACLSGAGDIEAAISRHADTARQLGFDATPAFVIGRLLPNGRLLGLKRVRGAQTVEVFRRALEEVIDSNR